MIKAKMMTIYIPKYSNAHLKKRMYPASGFNWSFSDQLKNTKANQNHNNLSQRETQPKEQ